MTRCETCEGTGLVWRRITRFNGKRSNVEFQEYCPTCDGTGTVDDETMASETGPNRIVNIKLKEGKKQNGSNRR